MNGLPDGAIGRYQILGFMARGEKTVVYEALDPDSGRHVALKILPPSAARDTQQANDFLRLAEQMARLDHANLLPVIDYGREDGMPYITTPVARGGRLDQHLSAYSAPGDALNLVASLAEAVDYLHQNDIVHGRVEPESVLLDDQGQPLLTGLGRPNAPGLPPRDPAYLAPEQRHGQAPDERTDIYQLGALLHLLLLGELPYPEVELPDPEVELPDPEVELPDLEVELPDPQVELPDSEAALPDGDAETLLAAEASSLDEDVQAILNKALATDPEERFQTAGEMAVQLAAASRQPELQEPEPEEIAAVESSETDGPTQPESTGSVLPLPFQNRNPLWLAAAVAVLAVILALCCLLSIFAISSVSGRLRQPRATAQIDTNVRAGPSIQYQIVGILRQGEQVPIYGISPDGRWWQIEFQVAPGGRGWLPAAFVTVDQLGKVDVVAPPPLAPEAALSPSIGWLVRVAHE